MITFETVLPMLYVTLPDWDMYEEMGMTPEESYHVAKQRLHPTVDIVPNVFTLDNPR